MSISAFEALADDRGQSSIDFIFGFGVFLLTFIYAISFVSGLFTPFQPGAIDLSSVSYRTSTILVEDPGWYIYTGATGHLVGDSAWETVNTDDMETLPSVRVGLADDKVHPNVLSLDKINALNALIADNYSFARDSMGLNSSASSIIYDVKLNLIMNNTLSHTQPLLMDTSCPNATSSETENIVRNVMIDNGKFLFIDAGTVNPYGSPSSMLQVDIQNLSTRNKDLKILFYNNVTSGTGRITGVWANKSTGTRQLDVQDEYTELINGKSYNVTSFPVNKGDVIEFIIYSDTIQDPDITNINIKADGNPPYGNLFPTSYVDYAKDKVYTMKSLCYPGVLKLEVWSNDYS